MKNLTLFASCLALVLAACNHAPLGVRKNSAQPSAPSVTVASTSTSSDTDTAIDAPVVVPTPTPTPISVTTVTATATGTSTAVDASVDDSTKTMTATATATKTKTPLVGKLVVDYMTAFHAATLFSVKIGQKSVPIGTFLFLNGTNKKLEVREFIANFIFSIDPYSGKPWSDASAGGADTISAHLSNCSLRGWPETKAYSAPLSPTENGSFHSIDMFEIEPFTGTNALGLDLVCDIVGAELYSELGIGVEVMDNDNVVAYDQDGNRAIVTREKLNGSPPQVAAIIQPPTCRAEKPVTIGNGIEPSIAGIRGGTGFGIVWKDNSHMPNEMNVGWFRSVDIGGNSRGKDQDLVHYGDNGNSLSFSVVATQGGYMANEHSWLYSNYSLFGANGERGKFFLNERYAYSIAGTADSFTFYDSGYGFPALHKLQVTDSGVKETTKFQWGPGNGSVVGNGIAAKDSWAFGLMDRGQLAIVIVRPEGVYPQTVKMESSEDTTEMGDLIVTDESYVLSWSRGGKRYLSFANFSGMSNGFVTKTVEISWPKQPWYQSDRIAWDGKHIALLTTLIGNGQTDVMLFDKNGKQMGSVLNMVPAGKDKWFDTRSSLAATDGTFGAVTSDAIGQTVKYYQIHCE